jgi:hypothetical protein
LVLSGQLVLKDPLGLKAQPARKDHKDRKESKVHRVSKVLLGLLVLAMLIPYPVCYHLAQG